VTAKKRRVRFKLGVVDRTLGLPGEPEAVDWAAELLFEGLVVSVWPAAVGALSDKAAQKRYRDGARKSKVTLAALSLEASEPGALEALLGQALPVAKALGVTMVRVPFPGSGRTDAEREFMTYFLSKVAPGAERAGVTLALSSRLPARDALALLGTKAKGLRISYDVGAAAREKLDLRDELRLLHESKRLGEVYLREATGYLGKGSVDVAAVVATLAELNYDRWVHLATDAPSGDAESDTLENQRYLRTAINKYEGH
jgi:sugar phosphate isomerase/epimerase